MSDNIVRILMFWIWLQYSVWLKMNTQWYLKCSLISVLTRWMWHKNVLEHITGIGNPTTWTNTYAQCHTTHKKFIITLEHEVTGVWCVMNPKWILCGHLSEEISVLTEDTIEKPNCRNILLTVNEFLASRNK